MPVVEGPQEESDSGRLATFRLFIQAGLAFGILGASTYLAVLRILSSDAIVGIYGLALGAVVTGAPRGRRGEAGPKGQTGNGNGNGSTGGGA